MMMLLMMMMMMMTRPICSRGRPDVRDRQTDVRRASSLNAPYARGGGIITEYNCLTSNSVSNFHTGAKTAKASSERSPRPVISGNL